MNEKVKSYIKRLERKDPKLTELDLLDSQINVDAIKALAPHLNDTSITKLDLSYNKIGSEGIKELAPYLNGTSITTLQLSNNEIGSEGIKALAPYLNGTSITTLELTNNKIGSEGIKALAPYLNGTSITKLNLCFNRIGKEGIKELAPYLKNTSITTLDLGYTKIGSEGIKELAPYLNGTSITTLQLRNNEIGSEGIKALAPYLNGTSITTLELSNNEIGSEGIEGIKELALNLNGTSITILDLSKNKIGDEGVKELARYLNGTSITTLQLSNNEISREGIIELALNLNGTSITILDLSENKIGDEGVKELARYLNGTSITTLQLSNNEIGCEGIKELAPCLKDTSITTLSLNFNIISDECIIKELAPHIKGTLITYLGIQKQIDRQLRAIVSSMPLSTQKDIMYSGPSPLSQKIIDEILADNQIQVSKQNGERLLKHEDKISVKSDSIKEMKQEDSDIESKLTNNKKYAGKKLDDIDNILSEGNKDQECEPFPSNIIYHIEIPNELLCPITKLLMTDPVTASDGETYERKNIEDILKHEKPISPKTQQILKKEFVSFPLRKAQISKFLSDRKRQLSSDRINQEFLNACKDKNLQEIDLFLKLGANILSQENGKSCLHLSIPGNIKIIEYLLNHGAILDSIGDNQNTPLLLAILNKDIDVIKYLLQKGASLEAKNHEGNNALSNAVMISDFDTVQLLFEYDAISFLEEKNNNGDTALLLAGKNKNEEIICFLLEKRADYKHKNHSCISFWDMLTANNGFGESVIKLIQQLELSEKTNRKGNLLAKEFIKLVTTKSPLFDKNHAIPELILNNTFIVKGWRAIHFASFFGDIDSIEILLKMDVDLTPAPDKFTPLHACALSLKPNEDTLVNIATKLLDAGVSVDAKIGTNETALNIVDKTNKFKLFKLLVNEAANTQGINNDNAKNAGINLEEHQKVMEDINAIMPTIWPTDYEYIMLCEHVYEQSLRRGGKVAWARVSGEIKLMNLENWMIHKIYQNKKTGYFAISYVNPQTRHLVLVHRGTDLNIKDLILTQKDFAANYEGVISGKFTKQHADAIKATDDALQQAIDCDYKFSIGGHSLGALEGGLSAFYVYKEKKYTYVHAVLFEPPGLKKIVDLLNHDLFPTKLTDFKKLDIKIYQSVPNGINTAGNFLRYSKMFRLYPVIPRRAEISQKWENTVGLVDTFLAYFPFINQGTIREADPLFLEALVRATWTHQLSYLSDTFNSKKGYPDRMAFIRIWPEIDLKKTSNGMSSFSDYIFGQVVSFITTPIASRLTGYKATVFNFLPSTVMLGYLISLFIKCADFIFPGLALKELLGYGKFLNFLGSYLVGDVSWVNLKKFYAEAVNYTDMEPYNLTETGIYRTIPINASEIISDNFEINEIGLVFEKFIEKSGNIRFQNAYHYDSDKHCYILNTTKFINFGVFVREVKGALIEYFENSDVMPMSEDKVNIKKMVDKAKNNLMKGFYPDKMPKNAVCSVRENGVYGSEPEFEPQTSSAGRLTWFFSPKNILENIHSGLNYFHEVQEEQGNFRINTEFPDNETSETPQETTETSPSQEQATVTLYSEHVYVNTTTQKFKFSYKQAIANDHESLCQGDQCQQRSLCEISITLTSLPDQQVAYSPVMKGIYYMAKDGNEIVATENCQLKHFEMALNHTVSQLPDYDYQQWHQTIINTIQEISLSAGQSALITASSLFAEDIALAYGYSQKTVNLFGKSIRYTAQGAQVASDIAKGVDAMTAILPLLTSNAVYYGLTYTGKEMNAAASIASTATYYAVRAATGSFWNTACTFFVSTAGGVAGSWIERKTAEHYLTPQLSEHFEKRLQQFSKKSDDLYALLDALEQQGQAVMTHQLRAQLNPQIKPFYKPNIGTINPSFSAYRQLCYIEQVVDDCHRKIVSSKYYKSM